MNIGSLEVGAGQPCRFISELGNAHNGDFGRALRLIDAAKAAGADAIKLQCYTPDELVALRGDGPAPEPWGSQGFTMRTLYEKAATPFEWFEKLFRYCTFANSRIPIFSSVFGLESLALLESLNCPAYKIARLDNGHSELIVACMKTGKPVMVSTSKPMTMHGDFERLYCPPGYPTQVADVRLPVFGDLAEWDGAHEAEYSGFVGLSSHCLAPELPIAAVARGAKLIEMHFHLEAEPSELEANVSLNEREFAAMVRSVRATEELLG